MCVPPMSHPISHAPPPSRTFAHESCGIAVQKDGEAPQRSQQPPSVVASARGPGRVGTPRISVRFAFYLFCPLSAVPEPRDPPALSLSVLSSPGDCRDSFGSSCTGYAFIYQRICVSCVLVVGGDCKRQRQDTTLNVMMSASNNTFMSLAEGGMHHLLAGARANVGISKGRYMFEVKVIEFTAVADSYSKAAMCRAAWRDPENRSM